MQPTARAEAAIETGYASSLNAVLKEIERFKQEMPALLKELDAGDFEKFRLIGLETIPTPAEVLRC